MDEKEDEGTEKEVKVDTPEEPKTAFVRWTCIVCTHFVAKRSSTNSVIECTSLWMVVIFRLPSQLSTRCRSDRTRPP